VYAFSYMANDNEEEQTATIEFQDTKTIKRMFLEHVKQELVAPFKLTYKLLKNKVQDIQSK